ncbi:hypothetical protein Tco_0732351 [Tanacetum coccineum]
MYDSWKTRIWIYMKGKENGEISINSIEKGPFQLKKKITIPGIDGAPDQKREQTVEDLSPKEKIRYDCDIKATNILLLGLPVDIYTLINHYQTTKEIWDIVGGTELTLKEHHVDAYDSDYDDEATTSAIFMASLFPASSLNDTEYTEHLVSNNDSYDELTSDSNVISDADYMVTIENDDAQYVPPI